MGKYSTGSLSPNVLQLPDGGDFEALHFQLGSNFDRSTKLDLPTEPPLLGRCCYQLAFRVYSLCLSFFESTHIHYQYNS